MLIHNYIEEIFGSRVKVKILRTMFKFPTKTFTGRELASLIKEVSHMAVANSIKQLRLMNLITIEHHGTSNLLRLNKKSYLFPIIKAIFKNEEDTIEILKHYITNKISSVYMIVLFGSVSRKKEKFGSDVDILVVAKDKGKVKKQLEKNSFVIDKMFGNRLNIILLNKEEFKKSKNKPFAKDLKKEYYILLKGKDLIKKEWLR